MTTAIVYGVGAMGAMIARFMLAKGVRIVGAIDANPALVGRDLGDVLGLDAPLGVAVSDDAASVLAAGTGAEEGSAAQTCGVSGVPADVAVLALFSQVEKMEPFVLSCVERGINVISTSRELSHPWSVAGESAARLDSAAKQHGVTVSASGFQDTFMVNAVSMLTGACQEISRIELRSRYDVNDFGAVVARDMRVDCEPNQVLAEIEEQGAAPSFARFCIEAIAADLGLELLEVSQETALQVDDVAVDCTTLGTTTVTPGRVTGLTEIVRATGRWTAGAEGSGGSVADSGEIAPGVAPGSKSASGSHGGYPGTQQPGTVEFIGEWTGKVLAPGQEAFNECRISGVPDVLSRNAPVDHSVTTATQVVNRIPDVIAAPPGFVTYERLPKLRFRPEI